LPQVPIETKELRNQALKIDTYFTPHSRVLPMSALTMGAIGLVFAP
jgi:hypothetical protein